jgi:hypothetical protein
LRYHPTQNGLQNNKVEWIRRGKCLPSALQLPVREVFLYNKVTIVVIGPEELNASILLSFATLSMMV